MIKWKRSLTVAIVVASMAGCANMTPQQKNTAIGAAVGGIAGSILTEGSGFGTVGGAALGGYIGNQVKH